MLGNPDKNQFASINRVPNHILINTTKLQQTNTRNTLNIHPPTPIYHYRNQSSYSFYLRSTIKSISNMYIRFKKWISIQHSATFLIFLVFSVFIFGIVFTFNLKIHRSVTRCNSQSNTCSKSVFNNKRFDESDNFTYIYSGRTINHTEAWLLVDSSIDDDIDRECTSELVILHAIPVLLLRLMTLLQRFQLCADLKTRMLTAENSSISPGTVFAHVDFGLGNRLRALGSLIAFANGSGRALVVIWESNAHLNASFFELFSYENNLIVIENFGSDILWPWCNSDEDPNCLETSAYNLIAKENPDRTHPSKFYIPNSVGLNVYIKSAYFISSAYSVTSQPTVPFAPTNVYIRMLRFASQVEKIVAEFMPEGIEEMIGVHVRGLAVEEERKEANGTERAIDEYGASNLNTTNYWRRQTTSDAFIDRMKLFDSSVHFFVASDSEAHLVVLEKQFPGRIHHISCGECGQPRDTKCVQYAVADLFLLSQCKSLLGSYYSSFSEVATRMGSGESLLAGRDFP